jgi:uncharacterized membrane protein YccC
MRESTESATALFGIPYRLGAALFRIHIENGVFVSLGMAVVGLGTALAFGRDIAVLAATGALCASVVDQPGPLMVKARMLGLAILGTAALTVATIFSAASPWLMGLVVAAMSFVSGLISAYGRRAIGLGVAAVLSLLFGMAVPSSGSLPASVHVLIFAAGGAGYAAFALASSAILDDRNRRMFLGEAVRAFGTYVAAKAALYDPAERARLAFQTLIENHAALTDRLQQARDMIFVRARTPSQLRWMAALLALLDCFDTVVSSDADIETLRQSGHRHLMRRLKALAGGIADDIEALALALMTPGATFKASDHASHIRAIEDEVERLARVAGGDSEPLAISAFRSTCHKLAQTVVRLERLSQVADNTAGAQTILPDVDYEAFVQQDRMDPRVLLVQLRWSSPVLRYAIRLTLAMVSGWIVTVLLPDYVHGGWVLLTTALIMRASFSVTKQRRNDRVLGTAFGCLGAAFFIHVLPRDWLFLPVIVTVGMAHAFAVTDFRITAMSASITALLQLHFLAAIPQSLFYQRIIDTLVGAALAWIFSFLLPSWEWRNVPKLVAAKLRIDRQYAVLALTRLRDEHEFRLARKQAHDATANLATTVRRLSDEPNIDRRALVTLNELIAANYLLASDLASMRVLFRMRKNELDPAAADTVLEVARANVGLAFDGHAAKGVPARLSRRSLGSSLGGRNAMVSLRRRLIHIERNVERVAALAARATSA